MSEAFEIELGDGKGRNHWFFPLRRRLRGRLDFNRMRSAGALQLAAEWPEPIPGQIVGLDGEKGYIVDPIHEHESLRRRIERTWRLAPCREEFTLDRDAAATWAYWMQRAVESGAATVIKGKCPKLEGVVKKTIFSDGLSPVERLVDKLVGLVADVLKLPESKRRELAQSI